MDEKKNKLNKENEEEIIVEEEADNPAEILKKIKEKLKKCETDKANYLTGWQRAKADYINAKKEEEEKRKNLKDFLNKELMIQFFELADGFDALFQNKEMWGKIDTNWRQGVENLSAQLARIFKENAAEAVESKGRPFDPKEHQAIGEVIVDKEENEGIVMEELRKGYKMNGILIRPSLVKVGKFKGNE